MLNDNGTKSNIASLQLPHPTEHLPQVNDHIRFSGELMSVENDEVLMIIEKLEVVPPKLL
jgi:hypothetical protein